MTKKHAVRFLNTFVSSLAVSLVVSVAVSILGFTSNAVASATGFKASSVEVKKADGTFDRRIYTEISRGPAKAPVVVLLNGLIYDIERWNPVAEELASQALTIVRMSFSAQPESLRLLEDGEKPSFHMRGLELSVLSDDVRAVLDHHRIKRAVTVVGLSYSGAVATEFAKTYPKRVERVVLLSPLVVPLDNYNPASAPLRSMLDSVRFWEDAPCRFYGWLSPWLCSSTDFWYDSFYNYFFESYLNQRVTAVPEDIEPALYKKSVFQLVRATRNYDLKNEVAGIKNLHMVVAQNDEPNLLADQRLAWSLTPVEQKRSFAEVTGVSHALPDEAPVTTASWILDIVTKEPGLAAGEEYVVEGM